MGQDTMVLLIGLLGTVMVTGLLGCAIGGAYILGRGRGAGAGGQGQTAPSEARLARIEALLESLALDVERSAEAQRYTSKELARIGESSREPVAPALPQERAELKLR